MKNYEVIFKENSEKRIMVSAENEHEAARIATAKYLETSKEKPDDNDAYEICIFVNEITPDVDDFIFNPEIDEDTECFRKALIKLCLLLNHQGFSNREIVDLVNDLPWEDFANEGFLDFQNVHEMEIDSTNDILQFNHGDLFGQKGVKIHCNIIEKIPGYDNLSEQFELWLLEDFSFAVVQRLHLKTGDDSNGDFMLADFRTTLDDDYFSLNDVYLIEFLDDIEEFMDCFY